LAREIDPKRTRKALRMVRRLAAAPSAEPVDGAAEAPAPALSGWEKTFLTEVEGRLDTFGSAFADLSKGRADEPLSHLQALKLREIAAKAAGKQRTGFARRTPMRPRRGGGAPDPETD